MAEQDPKHTLAATVPAGLIRVGHASPGEPTDTPPSLAEGVRRCGRCHELVPLRYPFCGTCGYSQVVETEHAAVYHDPLIGVVVGDRYRLLSRIGMGGMGSVYKAEHVRMGKLVAIKLLHGDLSRDEAMVRRFTREARAVSRLTSQHTVSVFDYGESEGFVYLVMEYLQGQDLGMILRTYGALSLPRAALVLRQIADSLAEAHQQGIIHRDLKPENIFICTGQSARGEVCVKVLDFGLAKLRRQTEDSLIRTARGSLIGTPYYMSPEQISGADVDALSDVYSLAALMFKVITGHPPYHHDNPAAVLGMHLSAPIPKASHHDGSLQAVDAVLTKALAKNPRERHATVGEFTADFIQAVQRPDRALASQALPDPETSLIDAAELSTRADFLRYEYRLKARRVLTNLFIIVLLVGGGIALWYRLIHPTIESLGKELEPNDTASTATRIEPGSPMSGTIGLPAVGQWGDVDFYLIENPTGREVMARIDVSGIPDIDLVLKTYTPSSEDPLVVVDSGGPGQGEQIPNHVVSGRHLYLQVREYWVEGQPAHYDHDVPYRVTVDLRNPLENEEREPNESFASAMRLRAGEQAVGMIGWAEDNDFFLIPGTRPGGALIVLDLSGVRGLDLVLMVFDHERRRLIVHDGAGAGQAERLAFFAQVSGPDALLVGVSAATPGGFSVGNHYRFEASYRQPFSQPWELPDELKLHLEQESARRSGP